MHLDKYLKLKYRIGQVRRKLTRFCGMVHKLGNFLSRTIFYEAYAKSIIHFGILIYGCTYRAYL